MEPVRVACVQYLNTRPLVEGLEKVRSLTLVPSVPSAIGAMVWSGEADLGLASIIDVARSPVPLTILPVGMIGCDGPTLTVRIFSRVPLDQVRELHADSESHTSVALAQLIFRGCFGVTPIVRGFDASVCRWGAGAVKDMPATLLLIGDKVVTDRPPEEHYPHQMDLGQAWKEWTGQPFVYAVWVCRSCDLEDTKARTRITLAGALLERQRLHNAGRLSWIVAKHAPTMGWPLDLAEKYVVEYLRYDMTHEARTAAEDFLSRCADAGLAPRVEPRWAEESVGIRG